jgi:hypothetical protein
VKTDVRGIRALAGLKQVVRRVVFWRGDRRQMTLFPSRVASSRAARHNDAE